MEMGLRRLNMPVLPFVNLASFHHESHALKGCNVRERITVDGDQIRFKTRHDGADRVLQIHRLGAVRGQVDQRIPRFLPDPYAFNGFSRVL